MGRNYQAIAHNPITILILAEPSVAAPEIGKVGHDNAPKVQRFTGLI
jgi:hypothetical protein